jgi:hypothetical protein
MNHDKGEWTQLIPSCQSLLAFRTIRLASHIVNGPALLDPSTPSYAETTCSVERSQRARTARHFPV